METINYCIVLPEDVNIYPKEGTDKWYELYEIISKLLKDKVYTGRVLDICSRDLYREGSNLIFRYKAVPATAPTMSTFPYYHALIMNKGQMINGE